MGKRLGGCIRTAGMEGGLFPLHRRADFAEHLTGRGLIELRCGMDSPQGLQDSQRAESVDVHREDRLLKGEPHKALSRQVVDFVWLDRFYHAHDVGQLQEIHRDQLHRIEDAQLFQAPECSPCSPSIGTIDFVAFFEKRPSQIGSILAGDPGNEGPLKQAYAPPSMYCCEVRSFMVFSRELHSLGNPITSSQHEPMSFHIPNSLSHLIKQLKIPLTTDPCRS